jgi:glycosyltransferase involved in cell wall biosynthesis
MTTAGICMCKDEADIIAGTLAHMADEVDFLIVSDNASTDGTREILAELEDTLPLTVLDDPETAYYQSFKMSRLAETAAKRGAEWIVPFDADELWIAPLRISRVLKMMPAGIVEADLYNHIATALDLPGEDPFATMVWRQRDKGALPKVAFRWEPGAVIHQGNHGVTLPSDPTPVSGLEIRHFPMRSPEQMVTKARNGAAAYAATDLPEHQGSHWRQYGALLERLGEQAMHDVFREHWWHISPTDAGLVHDPAPYRRWRQP